MTRQRIHIHREAGLSQAAIAVQTGTALTTVNRVLQEPTPTLTKLQAEVVSRPHGGRPSVATSWSERIITLFADRSDLPTTEVLHIVSTEWGYAGSRATFFRLVRILGPTPVSESMVRFEGLPGEFAQFDFGQELVTIDLPPVLACSFRPPGSISGVGRDSRGDGETFAVAQAEQPARDALFSCDRGGDAVQADLWGSLAADDFYLPKIDAPGPARAEGFHDGFFGGPAGRQSFAGVFCGEAVGLFGRSIDALKEALALPLEYAPDARDAD